MSIGISAVTRFGRLIWGANTQVKCWFVWSGAGLPTIGDPPSPVSATGLTCTARIAKMTGGPGAVVPGDADATLQLSGSAIPFNPNSPQYLRVDDVKVAALDSLAAVLVTQLTALGFSPPY